MNSRRVGRPDTAYTYNDARFGKVELVTDAAGLVLVSNEAERRAADALHLPVARKPKAKPKAKPTVKE